ncbi:DNA (cytosine-5-)-methyltransferase [Timonella sp. A28]|uniref:DNA (cytosine-5-)-methyltransferase n=1 Tax=Timonella sp. A28 TaxID=3442640 RepID=UPI003EB7F341
MHHSDFDFIDLFAGVGGFHAVGHALDGHCVLAAEIDEAAAKVYERNWKIRPISDVRALAASTDTLPQHDLLFAGFPCQPFSKSGKQMGEAEDRGNLFYSIIDIVKSKSPSIIMLENVRNLAGPKHIETLARIYELLSKSGYSFDPSPVIVSPHEISPDEGGKPQVRERVFIMAVRSDLLTTKTVKFSRKDVFADLTTWDKHSWDFAKHVSSGVAHDKSENLSEDEKTSLLMWEDFLQAVRKDGATKLSGFPIWSQYFTTRSFPEELDFPDWKVKFVEKNRNLYLAHRPTIDQWKARWRSELTSLPASKLKFEWQAQELKSIFSGAVQFRPSGIRVKQAYLSTGFGSNFTNFSNRFRKTKNRRQRSSRFAGFSLRF